MTPADEDRDQLIGVLAVGDGLLSNGQLQRLVDRQAVLGAEGRDVPLTELMVEEGVASREAVEELVARGTTIGGYELLTKLGKGGMGSVYRGRREGSEEIVAVKLMASKRSADRKFLRRFVEEARMLAKVDHPNVVKSFCFDNDRGYSFLVMEYVEGDTLVDRIEQEGQLEEAFVLRVGCAVARGLQMAWDRGLVHRDIKPENILLSKAGAVKVSDFGLAKDRAGGLKTTAGITFGTPHYMSPEQVRGRGDLDCRSDIYSLGGTMYHALSGRFPFDAENDVDVMVMHLEDTPLPLEELNPKISAPTVALIKRMMERHRDDRQRDPAAVCAEIESIIDGSWRPHREKLSRRIKRTREHLTTRLSNRMPRARLVDDSVDWVRLLYVVAAVLLLAFIAVLAFYLRN